jgi:hypothetical protein
MGKEKKPKLDEDDFALPTLLLNMSAYLRAREQSEKVSLVTQFASHCLVSSCRLAILAEHRNCRSLVAPMPDRKVYSVRNLRPN